MDYTSVLAAVDFASVLTALLSVAAVFAGVYVARRGATFVLGMIRKGS